MRFYDVTEEDDVVETPDWFPTPSEFTAYHEREVAMCKEAQARGLQRHETLFSTTTWLCALGLIKRRSDAARVHPNAALDLHA